MEMYVLINVCAQNIDIAVCKDISHFIGKTGKTVNLVEVQISFYASSTIHGIKNENKKLTNHSLHQSISLLTHSIVNFLLIFLTSCILDDVLGSL